MIDPHFINHYDTNNPELNLIIEAMCHPKKDDARRFLCMINDVVDYYTCRTDDEVRYPLLYIPASEPWAQEVCVEFVTLKFALLYNNLLQEKLRVDIENRNYVIIPENCTRRKMQQIVALFRYKKRIYKLIKDKHIPCQCPHKNLLICKTFDCSAPCNPFLVDLCGNEKTISNSLFALSRADIEVKKLDVPLKKDRGKTFRLENLLVFLSKSANGRFSDAYSFQKPSIERLNKLGAGIKNVFYFYFSTKPYKLQRQFIWKIKNAVDILHEDIKEMKDFISISSEESDYIFGRERRQQSLVIKPDELNEFKNLVDDALESCEYNIQTRNVLGVCIDEYSQKMFKDEYSRIIDDIDAQYFDIFLKNVQDTWENKIFPEIVKFLDGQTMACLILDYFIPDEYKMYIVSYFNSFNIDVTISTFKSLKYSRYEDNYISNNTSAKIVVLSFQGHYAGSPYSRYPNTFDPIFLNEGQELLNVINPFVLDPYYAAQNYAYHRTLRNILSSDYRKNRVKCSIHLPERPKREIDESRDRSTSRSENSSKPISYYKRYNATTVNGKTIKLTESDFVICKENNLFNTTQIISISTLNSLMQETEQSILMCPLSRIQDILETILKEKEAEIKKDELYIRKDPRYALSDDEIFSESEVWEILLRRKIEQRGVDIVYAEIMEKIPYSEQIRKQSFERWYTPNNGMILPRNRRMQDVLFQYLSIVTPYDKIIRRKKAQKGTKTEQKNIMLRSFLCNYLFSDDQNHSFEKLSDNIKNMLNIDNQGDLEALIDMLRKEIEYVEINTVSSYGKN